MCATVYRRAITPMAEAYLYVNSDVRGVILVLLHKNVPENCEAFVAQCTVEVVPDEPLIFKMADR